MRRFAVLVVFCLAVGGCSAGKHEVAKAPSKAPAQVSAVAKKATSKGGRATAPPVRMFAGVQSALGTLVQFCRGAACTEHGATVRRLPVAPGSVVTFAVDSAPDQAVLDVSGAGGKRVSLATATLMAYQGRLAPGAHRLTLQLRWGTTSATWVFDVGVKQPA